MENFFAREECRFYRTVTREEEYDHCYTPPLKIDTLIIAPASDHQVTANHFSESMQGQYYANRYQRQPQQPSYIVHEGPLLAPPRRAYVQTIPSRGSYSRNHQARPINSDDAARIFGGVVITDYGIKQNNLSGIRA